jgi:hypothetical protein
MTEGDADLPVLYVAVRRVTAGDWKTRIFRDKTPCKLVYSANIFTVVQEDCIPDKMEPGSPARTLPPTALHLQRLCATK